jgi:hypothetical protein
VNPFVETFPEPAATRLLMERGHIGISQDTLSELIEYGLSLDTSSETDFLVNKRKEIIEQIQLEAYRVLQGIDRALHREETLFPRDLPAENAVLRKRKNLKNTAVAYNLEQILRKWQPNFEEKLKHLIRNYGAEVRTIESVMTTIEAVVCAALVDIDASLNRLPARKPAGISSGIS